MSQLTSIWVPEDFVRCGHTRDVLDGEFILPCADLGCPAAEKRSGAGLEVARRDEAGKNFLLRLVRVAGPGRWTWVEEGL